MPASEHPSCSVVICTRLRPALLRACLESLAELTIGHEALVVDNSAGDSETKGLADEFQARYLVEPQPNQSRARNLGALRAKGSIVAFLDDDCLAYPDWLDHLAGALAEPGVAASTGRILIGDDPGSFLDLGPEPLTLTRSAPDWFERANFGGLGFGGNMAFRRDLFAQGFRFRETLGHGTRIDGCEELYAFFTLLRDGHSIAYVPEAVVRHPRQSDERAGVRRHAAYISLLLAEEPDFRTQVLRHVARGARREPPAWRSGWSRGLRLSAPKRALAAAAGAVDYLRMRLSRSRPAAAGAPASSPED
jgi:glycosyltransferase involved in cell wall biosynthesis